MLACRTALTRSPFSFHHLSRWVNTWPICATRARWMAHRVQSPDHVSRSYNRTADVCLPACYQETEAWHNPGRHTTRNPPVTIAC